MEENKVYSWEPINSEYPTISIEIHFTEDQIDEMYKTVDALQKQNAERAENELKETGLLYKKTADNLENVRELLQMILSHAF